MGWGELYLHWYTRALVGWCFALTGTCFGSTKPHRILLLITRRLWQLSIEASYSYSLSKFYSFIQVLGALMASKDEPTQPWCSICLACSRVLFLSQPRCILAFLPELEWLPRSWASQDAACANTKAQIFSLFLICISLLVASLLESLHFRASFPFCNPFSHLH